MKKKLLISALLLACIALTYKVFSGKTEIEKVREQYAKAQKKHPFSKTLKLSKKERKARAIAPDKYFEEKYLLEMNPLTGRTHPENVYNVRKELKQKRLSMRAPGNGTDSDWEERGPNDVGGRTRALLFDPNDALNNTVYAGGVSGGLWKNTDISNASSQWARVENVPGNLSVTSITVDPRDSDKWYVGTGEQYTAGDVVGNGVYMTSDGGDNWSALTIPAAGAATFNLGANVFLNGLYYVNEVLAWDNGTSTELFVAVGAHIYGDASDPLNWLGLQSTGIYRSTNGGTTWSRIESANLSYTFAGATYYYIPNDFAVGADNKIWMGTVSTPGIGGAGGKVYSSTNGSTWTEAAASPLTNSNRVELEASATDANKIYALTQGTSSPVYLYETTDGFATITSKPLPNDVDINIPANDFTNTQAWYNLMLAVDPSNDAIVYIGGIDLFRTTDSGTSWSQISKWSNNNDLATLNVSTVHADQHGWAFHPTNSNIAVSGNDGGVYYASSLSTASSSTTAISVRNNNYNVTQFVKASIGPDGTGDTNGIFSAGAQDNGTRAFRTGNTAAGINGSEELSDGDGFYTFVDKDGEYVIATYVRNIIYRFNLPWNGLGRRQGGATTLFNEATGDFVNPMDYDSDANRLLSNKTNGSSIAILSIDVAANTNGTLTDASLTDSPTAFRASPFVNNTWYVGLGDGGLIALTDVTNSSATFNTITTPFVGAVSSVRFGETANDLIVTIHNYGVTSIWYSSNAGSSWSSKEGDLPDFPVRDFLLNPLNPKEAIIATQLGVWATSNFDNASPTWAQSYNGMSDVSVTSLDYWNVSGDNLSNKIIAATYGRGVFTGKFTGLATTWTGAVDTDWATTGNWDTGVVPIITDSVVIPSAPSNQPVIGATTGVTVDNLTISSGASLSVTSGGSLIVNGTSIGNITYNVAIADTNWHLVSSPVVGEQYDNAWVTANSIAVSGSTGNRGISTYDNTTPHVTTMHWRYFTGGSTVTYNQGIGYSNLRTSAGNFSFTGTFPTTDVTSPISQNDQDWNLIGNPYPSYIDIAAFITANTSKLSGAFQAVYVWNGASYDNLTTGYIHPGQGFFVHSNVNPGTTSITEAMQSHQTGVTFHRTSNPTIKLMLSDGTNSKETQINYLDDKTTGLDPRFDLGMFDGTSSSLRVYTHLIEDNEGIALSRQALPNSDLEAMIVPVGVKAASGKEITFSVDALNLPTDIKVVLEDKLTNTFTRLDEVNTAYTITLSEALNGVGRFFLHTSSQVLGVSNEDLLSVSIYSANQKIHFSGLPNGVTKITIYNVLGKVILKETTTENTTSISTENVSKGNVYLVNLETEKGAMSKKIVLQ